MPNPYLPSWEYVPDGEPRVFGDRVYVYGSHDKVGTETFCDYKLKVWSASIDNLNEWVCHGDAFHSRPDRDHPSDTDWTDKFLYAPDVVEKDGKYYLYAYIVDDKGCVAVSDRPEGSFKLISTYKYNMPENICDNGAFIDPGVLVDDDGRVYIYCGFTRSYMAEINPDNMYEIIDGTEIEHIIPADINDRDKGFFEACSPRKIGDTYYLIYSPNEGNRLAYSTSDKPTGPFTYRGYLVSNGVDYPGGNDHGSVCKIKDQWYIFYHRMTNNSIMSRRGCVEKIELLPDGTFTTAEMTSLGFQDSLNPYQITPAEYACVLKGDCFITEKDRFTRVVTGIKSGAIIGYKYFDFGEDYSSKTMELMLKIRGMGCKSKIHILIDDYENGTEIGTCNIDMGDGNYTAYVDLVTGRHALYFIVEDAYEGWSRSMFDGRHLFELEAFVFNK